MHIRAALRGDPLHEHLLAEAITSATAKLWNCEVTPLASGLMFRSPGCEPAAALFFSRTGGVGELLVFQAPAAGVQHVFELLGDQVAIEWAVLVSESFKGVIDAAIKRWPLRGLDAREARAARWGWFGDSLWTRDRILLRQLKGLPWVHRAIPPEGDRLGRVDLAVPSPGPATHAFLAAWETILFELSATGLPDRGGIDAACPWRRALMAPSACGE